MDTHERSKIGDQSSRSSWAREEYLVHFLRDHGGKCPCCKYNLYQLTSCHCPECGAELRLTVGTIERYLGAWVTMVTSLCVGAGLGGFWLILFIIESGGPPDGMLVTVTCGIACIPLALLAVLCRKPFVRLKPYVQWCFALCGATLTTVTYVSFIPALYY